MVRMRFDKPKREDSYNDDDVDDKEVSRLTEDVRTTGILPVPYWNVDTIRHVVTCLEQGIVHTLDLSHARLVGSSDEMVTVLQIRRILHAPTSRCMHHS